MFFVEDHGGGGEGRDDFFNLRKTSGPAGTAENLSGMS